MQTLKEIKEIIDKIDTLKKQFKDNKQKIFNLDDKIQDLDFASDNTEVLDNISNQIINLKNLNEDIEENILELERKIQILSRFELEQM